MKTRSIDFDNFLTELRRVRLPTEHHQVAWGRQINSFANCLAIVDLASDSDPGFSKQLDDIRLLIADKTKPVGLRLSACFVVLDKIKKLADEKERLVRTQSATRK